MAQSICIHIEKSCQIAHVLGLRAIQASQGLLTDILTDISASTPQMRNISDFIHILSSIKQILPSVNQDSLYHKFLMTFDTCILVKTLRCTSSHAVKSQKSRNNNRVFRRDKHSAEILGKRELNEHKSSKL